MKTCEACQGVGYVLTCFLCHRDAPVWCYPGGCERVEPCPICEGYIEDEEDEEDEIEEEVQNEHNKKRERTTGKVSSAT